MACQRPVFHKRRAASGRWIRRTVPPCVPRRYHGALKRRQAGRDPAQHRAGSRPACPLAAWLTRKPNARRCASSIASIALAACGRVTVAVASSRAGADPRTRIDLARFYYLRAALHPAFAVGVFHFLSTVSPLLRRRKTSERHYPASFARKRESRYWRICFAATLAMFDCSYWLYRSSLSE